MNQFCNSTARRCQVTFRSPIFILTAIYLVFHSLFIKCDVGDSIFFSRTDVKTESPDMTTHVVRFTLYMY